MVIQPYLDFNGRCEEAVNFYVKALGAQVEMMMRNRDSPEPPPPGTPTVGLEEKILHCTLRIGESIVMASDGRCTGQPAFKGIMLSITAASAEESGRRFAALADGGQVHMPLAKTFFSPAFGMLADRFGVNWMVMTAS